uniref:Uncharacterized protein n=1 Tax=Anguilla anguilla TaxID=7936 RepID=A0A0E9UXS7_ANGAN
MRGSNAKVHQCSHGPNLSLFSQNPLGLSMPYWHKKKLPSLTVED